MKIKFLTIILFVISITLPLASYAETEHYSFVSQLGKPASIEATFESPIDSAVDSDGNVYVADSFNNQIQKFSSKGAFLTKWGDKDVAYGSSGISTDSDGDVYVVHGGGITKFSSEGSILTHFRATDGDNVQFTSPSGITVDHDGNVYVSDGNAYALGKGVLKFAKDNTQSDIQTVPASEKISQNYASPSKQFKSGISFSEIKCDGNLQLTQRYDGTPACVRDETVFELIKRGWTSEITGLVQSRDVFSDPKDAASSYMDRIIPTLDDFKNILSEPYDIDEIFSKFGKPHDDIGSGIHIYVYELNDSTEIWIGYVDDVWYVKHVDADGNVLEDLFAKNEG